MLWIDSWPYDLLVSGDITKTSEVTDYEVESGATVSDHIHRLPLTISTEGIVSDTPIGEIAQDPSRRVDDVEAAFNGSDLQPLPSAEAYERLDAIWREGRLVTIEIPTASRGGIPSRRTFKNMCLETLTEPLGKDADGGMKFSATWKQITFATNRKLTVRTAVPVGGGKNTKTKPAPQALVDRSVLWRRALPSGGALEVGFQWALVYQSTVYADEVQGDKQVGGTFKGRVWRFTGPMSANFATRSNGYEAPNDELSQVELQAFYKDMARDTNQARIGLAERLGGQDAPGNPNRRDYNDFLKNNDNMPDGTSMDRFNPGSQVRKLTEQPGPRGPSGSR